MASQPSRPSSTPIWLPLKTEAKCGVKGLSNPIETPNPMIKVERINEVRTRTERAEVMPREPRCRICRHESVRLQVNKLLDWRGVRIPVGRGKTNVVTYASILRDLQPLNEGRDTGDRITYDSLWVHAKRHYDVNGISEYWNARIYKELRKGLRGRRTVRPIEQTQRSCTQLEISTKNSRAGPAPARRGGACGTHHADACLPCQEIALARVAEGES